MPKSRIIKYPFAKNIAAAKNVNTRILAAGKKKSSPTTLKANNPKG